MLVCGPSTVEDTHEAVWVVVTSSFANEKEISVLILNATTGTHTVSTGTHTQLPKKCHSSDSTAQHLCKIALQAFSSLKYTKMT